jgi:DNA-binding IscR family transcriptional regulator
MPIRFPVRTGYAVLAAAELAAAGGAAVKAGHIALAHGISRRFLLNVLLELKRAGIVQSRRGASGGYRLARPPGEVTVAEILAAVDRPVPGSALEPVAAVEARLMGALEELTLRDLLAVAGASGPAGHLGGPGGLPLVPEADGLPEDVQVQ